MPKTGPVFEYISACCSLPARKPRAAEKSTAINPETKKPSKDVKGLGHWRCSGCGKSTKVSVRKPQPKVEERVVMGDGGDLGRGSAILQEVPTV